MSARDAAGAPGQLSDGELLKIRTEVQAGSARDLLERARVCLAESWSHDDWPTRVGSLAYFTKALADEVERVLKREQEWIRAAGQPDSAPVRDEAEAENAYVKRHMVERAMSRDPAATLLSFEESAAIEAGFRREYRDGAR